MSKQLQQTQENLQRKSDAQAEMIKKQEEHHKQMLEKMQQQDIPMGLSLSHCQHVRFTLKEIKQLVTPWNLKRTMATLQV